MRIGFGRFLLTATLIGFLVFVGLALATAATQVPARILVLCGGLAALTAISLRRLASIPVLPNRLQHLAAVLAIGGVSIVASVLDAEASAVPFVVAFLALVTLAALARDVSLGQAGPMAPSWDGLDRRQRSGPSPESVESES